MRYLVALVLLLSPLTIDAQQTSWFEFQRTPFSASEHLEAGMELIARGERRLGERHFEMIERAYPDSAELSEARYQRGLLYLGRGEGKIANKWFSRYLAETPQPEHFEEVFAHKLSIANTFRDGGRAPLFNVSWFPSIVTARGLALELYDEIYAAMPSHENGARALYGKGMVLWKLREYEEAVECMQGFIARFPRHDLAPAAYAAIASVYLDFVRYQPHNPDLLPLAQINMRKFRADFPTDERVLDAEKTYDELREELAGALVETGKFYERKGIEGAACVYYAHAVHDYVGTSAADFAIVRLGELEPVGDLYDGISLQDIAIADIAEE